MLRYVSIDQEEQRNHVGAGCEEFVGISEASDGAKEQKRTSQVSRYCIAKRENELEQRLGSKISDNVSATYEETTAGDRT